MSPRGLANRLPPEIRGWLEAELTRRGFADYSEVVEELNARLKGSGAEKASRSAVHRFGQSIEERIAAIKRTTEIARTVAAEAGDDEGTLNDALVRIVQDRLFNLVLDLEIDPEQVSIIKLGHLVADLGRASVQQKRHQAEVRQKVKDSLAALAGESKDAGGTLDPKTLRRVAETLYGIVG